VDCIEASDLRLPEVRSESAAEVATRAEPEAIDPRQTSGSALPSYIEEIERAAIQQALEANRFNKTKAAAQLGITFRAVRYKRKRLGSDGQCVSLRPGNGPVASVLWQPSRPLIVPAIATGEAHAESGCNATDSAYALDARAPMHGCRRTGKPASPGT